MPEVGFAFPASRPREVYFEFSLYPIAVRMSPELAMQWDILRERIALPLDGSKSTAFLGSSLSLMVL